MNPKELAKSVENGLKIIEFIQKNKENIQKTYGRSAITGLTTKQKASEWEEFIANQNDSGSGSGYETGGISGAEEESSQGHHSGPGTLVGSASISENNHDEPVGDRDHKGGDAADPHGESEERRGLFGPDSDTLIDIRDFDQQGTGESSISSGDLMFSFQDVEGVDRPDLPDSSGARPKRATIISDKQRNEADALDEVLKPDNPAQERRLKNMDQMKKLLSVQDQPMGPIKKGTDGSFASMSSKESPQSESGVIPSAPEFDPLLFRRSASAETVPESARCASMTDGASMSSLPEEIHSKIDNILTTQTKILEKLTILGEVKEEMVNIKKSINNLGLAVSTIESYINSLMIIIPGSGKDSETDQGPKSINPDLKMVIGRDNTRGRDEVLDRPSRNNIDTFGEDIFNIPAIDKSVMLEEIKKDKNHAAKFIPSEDGISYRVIRQMINTKIDDDTLKQNLLSVLENNFGKIPISIIYQEISPLLNLQED